MECSLSKEEKDRREIEPNREVMDPRLTEKSLGKRNDAKVKHNDPLLQACLVSATEKELIMDKHLVTAFIRNMGQYAN